ncbi:MAG: GspMb/PilO family protein [Pseudomonadota bacterium]
MEAALAKLINLRPALQLGVAWGLAATLALVILAVMFAGTSYLNQQSEKLTALREDLGRMHQLVAALPAGAEDVLSDNPSAQSGERSAEVLRASIQTMLDAVVAASGARMVSLGTAPDRVLDAIEYVGVSATVEGSVGEVHRVFYQLESHEQNTLVAVFSVRTTVSSDADEVLLVAQFQAFKPLVEEPNTADAAAER